MRLAKLVQPGQWDLLAPLRKQEWPDGTLSHVLAHLIPAPLMLGALWGVWWVLQRDLLWGLGLVVVAFQIGWQFSLEEQHSTQGADLPIWSMVWDIGTTAVGVAVTVWVAHR